MGKKKKACSIIKRSLIKQRGSKGSKDVLGKTVSKCLPRENVKVHQCPDDTQEKTGKSLPWPVDSTLRQASQAVKRLLAADATGTRGTSLKSVTLASHVKNKKAVHAVTIETLKHFKLLNSVIESLPESIKLDLPVSLVLVHELLLGPGFSDARIGRAETEILKHEQTIQRLYSEKKNSAALESSHSMAALLAARPRTARVNKLKISCEDALAWFRNPPRSANRKKWECLSSTVELDADLPDVLSFPSGTDLHDHPLVLNGSIILQNKSSCMPAVVLHPEPGWKILDACAAPGNKTTHLASLLYDALDGKITEDGERQTLTGKPSICGIIALDKDPRRLKRLVDNIEHTGTSSLIEARCSDFLSVDPESSEFKDVDAILLDPSCSGSGTRLSRMDYLLPSSCVDNLLGDKEIMWKDERITRLAEFQTKALRLALSFPSVRRIVYSTCSIHMAENEDVVAGVLEFAGQRGFQLKKALPEWHRRGIEGSLKEIDAEAVVRVDPVEDKTDGFFVALFEKRST